MVNELPSCAAGGETLVIAGGGSTVSVIELLEKFVPAMDTWQMRGCAVDKDVGISNCTVRLDPVPVTLAAGTSTADPSPAGGVMVTVTLLAVMVPEGKPVPLIATYVPGWAWVGFSVVRLTCAKHAQESTISHQRYRVTR